MAQKVRFHKHHIIPKHMGGSDDSENLITLTIEEHALAHKKLFEDYNKYEDFLAWKMLSGQMSASEAAIAAQKMGAKKGGEVTKQIIAERVAKGLYHLQSGDIQRKHQLKMSAEGTHNFLGLNEKRIAEGTHNRVGKVTCRNKLGVVVQIPTSVYRNQKEITTDQSKWDFVTVSCHEGKRRKELL